jgi:ubiquinone/menaquinone biosynthesis C-methylase UbiE
VARPTPEEIRDFNVRYHDAAAADYDSKWGISFEAGGRGQVVGKLRKALGREPERFESALEIGAGTGYFTINLLQAGVIRAATATDISQGMLDALAESADRLGLAVGTVRCEAASLPFEDDSFDLVFGHAVLHHLPDLEGAFAEFKRVLRPGGTLAFCGEPSRHGDRLASLPKRAALAVAPAWRTLMRAGARNGHEEPGDELEWVVDVHSFTPAELAAHAQAAGFRDIRVSGEELAASWFGWTTRTLESTADPDQVPRAWRLAAYHGYLALQRVDRALLEPRLPPAIFYNLLVSARAP